MRSDGELTLSTDVRRRLLRAAAAAYPDEACGVMLGRTRGGAAAVTEIVPLPNRAAAPGRSYRLGAAELEPLIRRGDVVGFYHSHPDGPPEFSARDARDAWPAYWYLVVETNPGREGGVTAWRDGRTGGVRIRRGE